MTSRTKVNGRGWFATAQKHIPGNETVSKPSFSSSYEKNYGSRERANHESSSWRVSRASTYYLWILKREAHFIENMHRTAWTKPKGSLPSDRIRPINKSPSNASKSKGHGKQQPSSEPPTSKEVKRLESLAQAIRNVTAHEKDPKGGCFCLGAFYTPLYIIFNTESKTHIS